MNGNDLATHLIDALQGVPAWLSVVVLTVVPVVEMQASFPAALGLYKMPLAIAFPLIVCANMIPAFIVLFGWDWFITMLEKRWPAFHGFMSRYHDRLHTRWQDKIDRFGPFAIFLFVAFPGPFSGVWSGSMLAWIFGVHRLQALIAIFLGVISASVFVALVTLGIIHIV